jgi:hypothetical protein
VEPDRLTLIGPCKRVKPNRSLSNNWPFVAPSPVAAYGIVNAISPRYCKLDSFASIKPKPNVLWIRGVNDLLIAEPSRIDFAELGRLKLLPHWPGADVYPPQPMISQTRAVLDSYQDQGGMYQEEVIDDCGHSPHIEKPERFRQVLFEFLGQQAPRRKLAEDLTQIEDLTQVAPYVATIRRRFP